MFYRTYVNKWVPSVRQCIITNAFTDHCLTERETHNVYAGAGVTMGTMDVCLPAESVCCQMAVIWSLVTLVNTVVGPSASWSDNKELKRNQMLKLKVSTVYMYVWCVLIVVFSTSPIPGPFLILAHLLPNPHAYIMHTLSVSGDV